MRLVRIGTPTAMQLLPRHRIDARAWDACVAASAQRVIYGFSWYLDTVLPGPDWKWMGLVETDTNGGYAAVMPVPLRQKWGVWRVHQPFFCQILGVFSRDHLLDTRPFYQLVYQRFSYGSVWQVGQHPPVDVPFGLVRPLSTQVLDLSDTYSAIHARYTPDRRRNLRRAKTAGWYVRETTDVEPLIVLFRDNHAHTIEGGVADWAYNILQNLCAELQKRGLATLLYTERNGKTEAGALFVQHQNRILYLFNAATEAGRSGNARTLLLDQFIQQKAGQRLLTGPVLLDFESPEKALIRDFYASFGAVIQPFWSVRWDRLTWPERLFRWLLTR